MCNYVDVTADFRSKETMLQHGSFSKESILAVLSSNLFIDVRIQGGPATPAAGQELTGLKSDDGVYAIFHSAIRLVWLEKSTPILKSFRGSAAKGLA